MSIAPVIRAITVDTPPDRAFAVFTDRIASWWPLATHTPAEELSADLAFVDGALVETSPTGEQAVWGTVTDWDPPRSLTMTWSPSGGPVTTVSVDFEATGDQTRVVLRHIGWEAYGDTAQEHRDSYDGEHAWGWVLDLFSFAVSPVTQPVPGGGGETPFDAPALRTGYEAVALALLSGPFEHPEPGEWNARQVAGHVTTNAELMCQVIDEIKAGRPARLHGPSDHAPEAVGRYDGVEYGDAAGHLRRTSAGFVARCAGLTAEHLSASVPTYIEHRGSPVVDGEMTLGELLAAEVAYHLPAHARQLSDLRSAVLAD